MPPIAYSYLVEASNFLPEKYRLIYQSEEAFQNSWSFKPLNKSEREELESRWISSSP